MQHRNESRRGTRQDQLSYGTKAKRVNDLGPKQTRLGNEMLSYPKPLQARA